MASPPILVKRYARSRLYDTARGRYVTIDELRQWQPRRVHRPGRRDGAGRDARAIRLGHNAPGRNRLRREPERERPALQENSENPFRKSESVLRSFRVAVSKPASRRVEPAEGSKRICHLESP
jgi:PHB/PHA accumulation regulator DNA-binding domain